MITAIALIDPSVSVVGMLQQLSTLSRPPKEPLDGQDESNHHQREHQNYYRQISIGTRFPYRRVEPFSERYALSHLENWQNHGGKCPHPHDDKHDEPRPANLVKVSRPRDNQPDENNCQRGKADGGQKVPCRWQICLLGHGVTPSSCVGPEYWRRPHEHDGKEHT